jgi:hypothetical protein
MPQTRRNNHSFQTELATKFWVVPLSCNLWYYLLSMLVLILNNVALLSEEPKHEIWRVSLSHFSPTAALCFRKINTICILLKQMRLMWAETGINGVILTAAPRVLSFQSFLLDVASWSWDIHPNIIPLPFRLPKQVSCSDNKVSSLIHIAWDHVTIVTKERLPGYSEIHFVVIITSRKHYASTFSPYYLFRLQCDFMCSMPWKTHSYSAILSELLIFLR